MKSQPAYKAGVLEKLKELGVDYRQLSLGDKAYTVEDVVRLGKVPRDEVCKTLLLVEKRGNLSVLVLVPGDRRVDMKKVEALTRLKLRLANQKEVADITGFEVGALPPFGHRTASLTVVDQGLMLKSRVNFGTGIHDTGAEIDPRDLPKVMTFTVADISRQ